MEWMPRLGGPWWPRRIDWDRDGERVELERPNFSRDWIGVSKTPPKMDDLFFIVPYPKHFWQRWLLRLAGV